MLSLIISIRYLKARKIKKKRTRSNEGSEFPDNEQVKFGEVVDAPPKLSFPKVKPPTCPWSLISMWSWIWRFAVIFLGFEGCPWCFRWEASAAGRWGISESQRMGIKTRHPSPSHFRRAFSIVLGVFQDVWVDPNFVLVLLRSSVYTRAGSVAPICRVSVERDVGNTLFLGL